MLLTGDVYQDKDLLNACPICDNIEVIITHKQQEKDITIIHFECLHCGEEFQLSELDFIRLMKKVT